MSRSMILGATSLTVLTVSSAIAAAEPPRCEIDFGPIMEHVTQPAIEVHDGPVGASTHLGSHGQLLFGEDAVFLHHLPFLIDSPSRHPHNFQVLMRVSFVDDADEHAYLEQRKQFPDALFTALPAPFNQDQLQVVFEQELTGQPLGVVELFDQHFESFPQPEPFLTAPLVVDEVVQFNELLPTGPTADTLRYLIVQGEQEAFIVHELSSPPDFDQVLKVSLTHDGPAATGLSLDGGVLRTVGAANNEHERLIAGDTLSCSAHDGTRRPILEVTAKIEAEVYCEAGELSAVANSPEFEGKRACASDQR